MKLPDFSSLREGRPDCPSDFTLDRLHAGELPSQAAAEAERHVAGCAECGARMAGRRAGFDGLEGVDPRAMLARIRSGLDRPPSLLERLRRFMAPLAVAATAAVALLVFTHEAPGTRLKGPLGLRVFRLAGEHAEEMVSGAAFAPGDRLRFTVDLPGGGHVAVLGVEASGALYTAWPLEAGATTRFEAGSGLELPGAVALDAQPGRETLYLVHCPLEVGPPRCASRGAGSAPECPEGCATTSFLLEKRP
ncbi:MAG TPA: hypothetical protein VE153_29405 [Myxococcus sp.]|nr:hypothetical protein [Myxococcus sp.]